MNGLLALIGFAAVLLGFTTAVIGLLNQRRIKGAATSADQAAGRADEASARADETAVKVDGITVSVDGRLTALYDRLAQLLAALHDAGVAVPPLPAEKTLLVPSPQVKAGDQP